MKKTAVLLAILFALMVSVAAVAQPGPPENPEGDPTTGSGGGTGCATCESVGSYSGNQVQCIWWPEMSAATYPGYVGTKQCTAHNAPIGPPYCETSGSCNYYPYQPPGGTAKQDRFGRLITEPPNPDESIHPITETLSVEQQAEAIAAFIRASALMSPSDLDDFVARTDFALRGDPYQIATQKRLEVYRSKFASLEGRELKPGHIPVIPHKANKAPATTVAAR